VGNSWPISLGKKGMSWGKGLHQVPPDQPGDAVKKEGDLTAPAGIFKLGKAFGYSEFAAEGSRWPYQPLSEGWVCVDDPTSERYNDVFDAKDAKKDWSSAEVMRRKDHLYKWLINVEQNWPTTCGCGSCIFIHIWRRPGAPTEGCTAMEETQILELLRWLDPAAQPLLIQLPDEAYARFRDAWNLP
jgi:zinc D-Ala-D-Ala dipeptidase